MLKFFAFFFAFANRIIVKFFFMAYCPLAKEVVTLHHKNNSNDHESD